MKGVEATASGAKKLGVGIKDAVTPGSKSDSSKKKPKETSDDEAHSTASSSSAISVPPPTPPLRKKKEKEIPSLKKGAKQQTDQYVHLFAPTTQTKRPYGIRWRAE